MVAFFGLNEKLGNVSYYDSSGQSEYSFSKPYSVHTAELIDHEVSNLIEIAYQRAKEILIINKENVHILAEKLLTNEVIFREDLEQIFGQRPIEFNSEQENKELNIAIEENNTLGS